VKELVCVMMEVFKVIGNEKNIRLEYKYAEILQLSYIKTKLNGFNEESLLRNCFVLNVCIM